jgi:hypothetical protein
MLGASSPAPAESADLARAPLHVGPDEDDADGPLPQDDLDSWDAWSELGDVGHRI